MKFYIFSLVVAIGIVFIFINNNDGLPPANKVSTIEAKIFSDTFPSNNQKNIRKEKIEYAEKNTPAALKNEINPSMVQFEDTDDFAIDLDDETNIKVSIGEFIPVDMSSSQVSAEVVIPIESEVESIGVFLPAITPESLVSFEDYQVNKYSYENNSDYFQIEVPVEVDNEADKGIKNIGLFISAD